MNNFTRQWLIVKADKWLFASLTVIPLLLALMIWGIFSAGVARDLPIGVVNLEHSTLSRELAQSLDASPTLSIHQNYPSVAEAKAAMVQSDIYGFVVIPKHFERDIYLSKQPQVDGFYNSQFILIGKLLNASIQQTVGTLSAKLSIAKTLAAGDNTVMSAAGKSVVVQTQISPLFNQTTNYAQFLVTAIIPALWQVFIVAGTILILNANLRNHGTIERWLETKPLYNVANTLIPYLLVFMLMGIGFLVWFYVYEQWLFSGHYSVVIFAQFCTTIACMIMGSFFYFMTLDPARAMSFAGAFTAPSFAFMGITFPTSDMNAIAQFWRSLLPISHYIEVQVAQSSYGVTVANSLLNMTPMLGYLLVLLPIASLIKRHMGKVEV